jgi:hypothetical protein
MNPAQAIERLRRVIHKSLAHWVSLQARNRLEISTRHSHQAEWQWADQDNQVFITSGKRPRAFLEPVGVSDAVARDVATCLF